MRDAIGRIASLKLTLAGLLLLGGGVLVYNDRAAASASWIVAPLVLLALNLIAALLVNPRFRRQPPLLAFHVCLLLIALLAAAGQLMRLDGRLEIAEGQTLQLDQVDVLHEGPLHRWALPDEGFVQGPISVRYAPGVIRKATRSEVRLRDASGARRSVQIGDDVPLIVDGYRFYTTSNKGWAVLLSWRDSAGADTIRGAVHMPSYPFLVRKQRNRWRLPGGEEAELRLELADVPTEEAWTLQSRGRDGTLVVRVGDREERLAPGASLALEQGTLRFDALHMWMGYRVVYSPFLPWIAACAVAAVLSMSWHFRLAFWPSPSTRSETTPVLGEASHGRA